MEKIYGIIGGILMIPFVIAEAIIKFLWSVVYSLFKPVLKRFDSSYYMEKYAYRWRGQFLICNWILDLWN